jgi:hypothetical protein
MRPALLDHLRKKQGELYDERPAICSYQNSENGIAIEFAESMSRRHTWSACLKLARAGCKPALRCGSMVLKLL